MPLIKNDSVIIENRDLIQELKDSEFGKTENSKLKLSHIEALYLLNQDKLKLDKSKEKFLEFASKKAKNFELKFLIYKDLRERGLFVKEGGKTADFFLYKRGDRPSKNSFSNLIFVLTERKEIKISELLKKTEKAKRLRKNSIIAFVDGEGDITYYETKKFNPKGKLDSNFGNKTISKIFDDRIIILKNGKKLYIDYFFGKPFLEESYQLNFPEAYYLSKKGVLDQKNSVIRKKGKDLDSKFDLKVKVYEDLRDKGLVPKTGFKFGTHFRVYKDYENPSSLSHAKYLVQALEPSTKLNPPEISRAVRLAQNVRKKMLFAIVDKEINYLELNRVKI